MSLLSVSTHKQEEEEDLGADHKQKAELMVGFQKTKVGRVEGSLNLQTVSQPSTVSNVWFRT